jgi:hypothetical protein
MRFAVRLQTRSPLAISLGRATGNQLQTARHIPGSVWRGAVAAAFIREHGLAERAHENQDFSLLFLQQKVRFGDLLPSSSRPLAVVRPLVQATAGESPDHRSSARRSGFAGQSARMFRGGEGLCMPFQIGASCRLLSRRRPATATAEAAGQAGRAYRD